MIKKTPRKELPLERKHTKWICGKLKVNQGSSDLNRDGDCCDHQTDQTEALQFKKSLEIFKIWQISRNPSKNCCFLCCASCASWQGWIEKSCDICKFTRVVANLRDCAPDQSIPPFVSDGGKERRSFKFFRREIRGVRIEKSGAALAQIHTPLPARHHHYSRSTWSSYFQTLLPFIQVNSLQKTSPQTKILLML